MEGLTGCMDRMIKKIITEEGAKHYELSRNILKKLPEIPLSEEALEDVSLNHDKQMGLDKETLRLISFKGEFLKP
jgi:hypothetical protein